jgi:hypothetical protein
VISYFQCTVCYQIEPEANWLAASTEGSRQCPHCHSAGKQRAWPTAEVQELIHFVQDYEKTSPSYSQVTCVFLASALELMLEELLGVMAYMDLQYEEASILVEPLLEAYQGRSRMLQLYRRLGHDTFPGELQELGHSQFWEHWNTIALARNRAVHGKPKEIEQVSPSLVGATIEEALAAFALLHNQYNQESLCYEAALQHPT